MGPIQYSSRLVALPVFIPLDGKPSIHPAWGPSSIHPAWLKPRFYPAWREPSIYPAWLKPRFYPAWRASNPEPCTERIPSPACGGRGSHEKNARIFFMGTREGGRRPEGGNTNPVFTPLDGCPQTQHLSRLATARKPSVYPAWLPPTNPVFTPLGGCPQTQHLSRLAAARKPRVCPAWRLPANPAFIPLGSLPQT